MLWRVLIIRITPVITVRVRYFSISYNNEIKIIIIVGDRDSMRKKCKTIKFWRHIRSLFILNLFTYTHYFCNYSPSGFIIFYYTFLLYWWNQISNRFHFALLISPRCILYVNVKIPGLDSNCILIFKFLIILYLAQLLFYFSWGLCCVVLNCAYV